MTLHASVIRRLAPVISALLVWAFGLGAAAQGIPAGVRINAFMHPAGDQMDLVVRAPLGAMRDLELPLRGPGYLDISRADQALRDGAQLWVADNIDVFEDGTLLPPAEVVDVRVSLPSDRSFASYEEAIANFRNPPLEDSRDLVWNQQFLDVLLEIPIRSEESRFSIHPRVDPFGAKVTTTLNFLPPDGSVRAFEFHGDPGVVPLEPRWDQAAWRFVSSGFWHMLDGIDHLVFLLCLVIPFRRLRPLLVIAGGFAVASFISVTASALGFLPRGLWFAPLIGTLTAASIVYVAVENIVGSPVRRRWIIAFAFGAIHGYGFSFFLRDSFQFAGDHLLLSVTAFNLGIVLGQIAALLVLVPVLELLFRHVVAERIGIIILSAIAAHAGWHWLTERGADLLLFPFPVVDALFVAGTMRALFAFLVLAAGVWLVDRWLRRGGFVAPRPERA